MPIIQAYTSNGQIIEKARWEIDSLFGIYPNDTIQISMISKDADLYRWANLKKDKTIWVEKTKGKEFTITVAMTVHKFVHLLEDKRTTVDSMAILYPTNKIIEQILVLVMDPNNVDLRFKKLMQGKKTIDS